MVQAATPGILTSEEIEHYQQNGYLYYDQLLGEDEIDALVDRVRHLADHPVEGVGMQVEPRVARGEVTVESKFDALRKVDKLVEHDDLFGQLARHPKILPRIQDILGPDIRMFRDAILMKPARHGSAKPYHQDSAYWDIQPMDLCSIWMALDEATIENGCMGVIPGSHKMGLVEHKQLEDFQIEDDKIDRSKEVHVPLKKGGILFFHSLLFHGTSPNNSDRPRKAMVVSYMRANSTYTGDPNTMPNYPLLSGQGELQIAEK